MTLLFRVLLLLTLLLDKDLHVLRSSAHSLTSRETEIRAEKAERWTRLAAKLLSRQSPISSITHAHAIHKVLRLLTGHIQSQLRHRTAVTN